MKRLIMSGVVALAIAMTSQSSVMAHANHNGDACAKLGDSKMLDSILKSTYENSCVLMLEQVAQGKMSVDDMERALAALDKSLHTIATVMKTEKDTKSKDYVYDLWDRIYTEMRKSSLEGVGKVISRVSYMTANAIALTIFCALLWAVQEQTHAFTILADNVVFPLFIGAGKAFGKGLLESGFKLLPEVPLKDAFIGLYEYFPLSSANVAIGKDLFCNYSHLC